MAGVENILKDRKAHEKGRCLKGPSNAKLGNGVRFHPCYLLSVECYISLGELVDTSDEVEDSTLSCTIRADETKDLTLKNIKVHIAHRSKASEMFGQVAGSKKGHSISFRPFA